MTTRQRASNSSSHFFRNLGELLVSGVTTHDGTKSNSYHAGSKTTHIKIPLCFLAARHNRENAFRSLLSAFGEEIHLLVDDHFQGNILHHIYGRFSDANERMINIVFDCLEKHLSKDQLLQMIGATDKHQKNVLWYAQDSDAAMGIGDHLFTRNLEARIASYTESPTANEQPFRRGFGLFPPALSMSGMTRGDREETQEQPSDALLSDEQAARILLSFRTAPSTNTFHR